MFEKFWAPNGTTITKRFVASLDVLGFKQRLAQEGLGAVFSSYQGLQIYLKQGGTKLTVLGTLFGATVGLTKEAPYVLLSDTIMLWCDEHGDVASFVEVCASVTASATERDVFLRGAIAFGDTIIDPPTNTFIGQPIVDAHLAETAQEWVGLGVHPTALNGLRGSESVVEYKVPIKNEHPPELTHAITWHHYLQASDALARLAAARAKAGPNSRKYDEASKFVRAFPLDAENSM
ncbi:MAG: hypothetical protein ABSC94_31205 [Polyangiaceae bacterium]|jgi:hypothetical protein